jgi:hypothetical protein
MFDERHGYVTILSDLVSRASFPEGVYARVTMEQVLAVSVDCRRSKRVASSANLASRMTCDSTLRAVVAEARSEDGRADIRESWVWRWMVMDGEGLVAVGRAMYVEIVSALGCNLVSTIFVYAGWGS